jgi:predicted transcriptional regulator
MQYRDRSELIRQILDIVNGAEDITKTKLMYNTFLSLTIQISHLYLGNCKFIT